MLLRHCPPYAIHYHKQLCLRLSIPYAGPVGQSRTERKNIKRLCCIILKKWIIYKLFVNVNVVRIFKTEKSLLTRVKLCSMHKYGCWTWYRECEKQKVTEQSYPHIRRLKQPIGYLYTKLSTLSTKKHHIRSLWKSRQVRKYVLLFVINLPKKKLESWF